MNRQRYRIVFNRVRGLLMVVAENVYTRGKGGDAVQPGCRRGGATHPLSCFVLRHLSASVALACGSLLAISAQAAVVAYKPAPKSQQATILNAGNGVPLVNIQTPSAAGVSHNKYSEFDVGQEGVILNNSRTNVQTQLGGWVQGNPWLATGTARVILNEVISPIPSQLLGYIEVAGSRAEVIIANPAGITCNGCGFINASQSTLTTGRPLLNNGNLDSYRVEGGIITIEGRGLDASRTDYANLIARAMQVNAGIWANTLTVTTGTNQVDAASGNAVFSAGTGSAPTFAIDVGVLGGMYAGKITLVGTEAGVGVRNAGEIGAGSALVLTADGRLENSGRLIGAGDSCIAVNGALDNSGTFYAQGSAELRSQGDISNTGIIAARGDTQISAAGQIAGSSASLFAAGLNADGTLASAGNLNLTAGQTLAALGQNLAGADQSFSGSSLDLSGSETVGRHLSFTASSGGINATNALISASGTLAATTSRQLTADGASVSALQLNLAAHDLSNIGGKLLHTGSGDFSLSLLGNLDNTQGRIAANATNFTLSVATLTNSTTDPNLHPAGIEHAGAGTLSLSVTTLNGANGLIRSNGKFELSATSATLDGGTTLARQLTLDTASLSNRNGEILQTGNGALSLAVTDLLDNAGGVIASNGSAAFNLGQLDNRQGEMTALQSLNLTTRLALDNGLGLIASSQALDIQAGDIVDNVSGTIASINGDLAIQAGANFGNTSGTLSALGSLSFTGQIFDNSDGWIQGASLALDTQSQAFDNERGTLIAGSSLSLLTGALNNDAGLIQSGDSLSIDTQGQTLTNINSGSNRGLLVQGSLTLASGSLDNRAGYLGAQGTILADAADIQNANGTIIAEDAITLTGSNLDNQAGRIEASGDLRFDGAGLLDNRKGLLRSGQSVELAAASVDNRNTLGADRGIEGAAVAIDTLSLDNRAGAIRADDSLIVTAGTSLNNNTGLISSLGTLVLSDRLAQAGSNVAGKTLAITNTDGTVIAGTDLRIDSKSLSGDGKVLSEGDLTTKLTADYTHFGEWQANGDATFLTTGTLINQAKLLAGGGLSVTAANLDNRATGEIVGADTTLQIAGTLTNPGLIDGGENFISAGTLNNLGTGRIYGDQLAIAATTLNNADETVSGVLRSAVIAARERLDIGAQNISNRNGALLFSAGDMSIGGGLDANRQATGSASQLTNLGATIEALGNLAIAADNLENRNAGLTTKTVVTSNGSFDLFTPDGTSVLLDSADYPGAQIGNFNISWRWAGPYRFRQYYRYQGTSTTTSTELDSSAPGKILSAGSMNLRGNILNADSQIIAGSTLDLIGASLTNTATPGQVVTSYSGSTLYYDYDGNESCSDPGDGCYDIRYVGPYNPANRVTTFSLPTVRMLQNTTPAGSGTTLAALMTGSLSEAASGSNGTNTNLRNRGSVQQVTALSGIGGTGFVIRSVTPNTTVPGNSLYRSNPGPGAGYLIETDPAFASYRTWLSSDYMLQQLAIDPALTQKRLGDGFYEQRLMREQVSQLTGRRFLEGYASDETQYQALMTAGASVAKAWNLTPGVALSEAQMAQLTTDIVWLVEKTVTLADGSTQKVLVPQVYVRVQEGDLLPSGALIASDNIHLQLDGDLVNGGTIAGRKTVSLTADNIKNLGGRIAGNQTALKATTDILNQGGRIEGGDRLSLEAGRDITVETTTQSSQSRSGRSSFSRTNLDRVASLYVSNHQGILVASAGRDINLIAAEVVNRGETGQSVLAAGRDLNLGTVTIAEQNATIKNASNYVKHGSSREIGSTIDTQSDITLLAGRDLSARAANVSSDGAIVARVGNDLMIEAGEASTHMATARKTKKSGTFGSKKTERRDTFNDTEVISSTFSGDRIDLSAGRDLTVKGSNVVGTGDVNLAAGNNVTLTTAQATHDESHYYKEKKSGVFSNGAGVTVGSQKLKTTNDSQSVTNVGSTVGSVAGNVDIEAGKQYTQTGSALLAPKGDIGIFAHQVNINAATDTYNAQQTSKFKSSGVSVSIGSSLVNLGEQVATSAQNTLSGNAGDQRLHALQTYANGATLYEQGTAVGKALQAGEVQDAAQAAGAKISVSLGTSKSSSSSSTQITTQQGSAVMAGGNVLIRATEDDLTVQGSEVSAGKNLALLAAENLNLLAGVDTEHSQSKNKSSSASIGVSAGVGAGMAGVSVDAAVSRGKGKANSDSTTYNSTHVSAVETLILQSGSDTSLIGAKAAGKRVVADIDGNLNIESLQDNASSQAKQSNTGVSVSVPVTSPGKFLASASQSREKAIGNYASVYEQSGIEAGSEGFQIHVQGNTDLKGALIDSTAKADKNHLTTGTLTVSDIENRMEAKASSSGTTVSSDMLTSKYAATKGLARNVLDNGEAETEDSSITRSAVAPGAVVITDGAKQQQLTGQDAATTVATLDRDTTNTNRVLAKPYMQALQDKAQQERADGMLLFNAVTAMTDEAYRSRLIAPAKGLRLECPAGSDCDADPKALKTSVATPEEIANADSDAVLATNGILNDEQRAAELAYQNVVPDEITKQKPRVIYVMHIAPADNFISEMLGVAYENITAKADYGLANFLGYTNGQELYAEWIKSRGQQATESLGHSRGTLTQSAAFTILANRPDAEGNTYTNPGLSVRGVGGAMDAVEYTDKAAAITTEDGKKDVTYNYFSNDPVSTSAVSGSNPGVWTLKDLWQVLTTPNSMHSCYGTGSAGCTQVEIPVPGGPQGTPEGNAKLIRYRGGQQIDADGNPVVVGK